MNRIKPTIIAAIIAGLGVGSAFAADKATEVKDKDKTQVAPGKQAVDPTPPATMEKMDANVQRQHDRDPGAKDSGVKDSGVKSGSSGDQTAGSGATGSAAGNVASGGRDWNKIDANDDNLVGPEEMENYLQQNRPQAGATGSSEASKK